MGRKGTYFITFHCKYHNSYIHVHLFMRFYNMICEPLIDVHFKQKILCSIQEGEMVKNQIDYGSSGSEHNGPFSISPDTSFKMIVTES